jgi:peroxiredoxin
VVLVDFWATFCKPCLRAMPELDALYRARKASGFVVLGVSIDGPDSTADVQATVARLGVTFPILLDQDSRAIALYNPRASAPFSVLIGRDGRVLAQREGYTSGAHASIEQDIDAALH